MSRLFESIRIQNGKRYLLDHHSRRFNQSRKAIFGIDEPIDLKKQIKVPDNCKQGLFKCRIVYDEKIRSITFDPYQSNPVQSLRLVHEDAIQYDHKYIDRDNIDQLYKLRSGCDDVLIVRKGLITDTSICNIVFLKGGKWLTPKVSLLQGVQRQQLLDKGIIKEANITLQQLSNFTHFKLINAMKPFSSATVISIDKIRF